MFEASIPEEKRERFPRAVRVLLAVAIVIPSLLALMRLMRPAEAKPLTPPSTPPQTEPKRVSAPEAVSVEPPTPAPEVIEPTPAPEIVTEVVPLPVIAPVVQPEAAAPAASVELAAAPPRVADEPLIPPEITALLGRIVRETLTNEKMVGYRVLRTVVAVLIVTLPLLMLFGLPVLTQPPTRTLANYTPFSSDDLFYWRQAASFSTVGFQSGYFTFEEQTAPVGNYYAWGIFIPVLQGTLVRLTGGMTPMSIPLINAALLSLALVAFLIILKPSLEQEFWLLGGLVVFAPLWVAHITSMSEMMQFAMMVLVAAVFCRLLATTAPTRRLAAAGLVVVFVATLLRPSVSIFFIPLCLLLARRGGWRSLAVGLVAGVALAAAADFIFLRTSAPYPFQDWLPMVNALPTNPAWALEVAVMNVQENLSFLSQGVPLEQYQRIQIGVGILLLVGMTIAGRRWRSLKIPRLPMVEALLHLYNLSVIVVFYLLLYDMRDWRDFRGMATHLLFSLLLFVAFRRRFWLALFVVSGVLILPETLAHYNSAAGVYLSEARHAEYAEWQEKLADVLVYQPDAPSPWCNTITHGARYLIDLAPVLALPPQIGTSFVLGMRELHDPPYSRYLMMENDEFTLFQERFARLEKLADVPNGAIYLNPDSACHDEPAPAADMAAASVAQ